MCISVCPVSVCLWGYTSVFMVAVRVRVRVRVCLEGNMAFGNMPGLRANALARISSCFLAFLTLFSRFAR